MKWLRKILSKIGSWFNFARNDGSEFGDDPRQWTSRRNNEQSGSGLFGNLLSRYTGNGLTDAEMQANAFSAEQAQIAREWDEKMYNQYNSPAALMRQYQEAGLNPSMVAGGSMPSMSSSSSGPSSVTPQSENLVDAISQLASLRSVLQQSKAQTELLKAQAEKSRNETEQIQLLTPVQVREAESRILQINQNIKESEQRITESEAHSGVLVAQRLLAHQEYGFNESYNELLKREKELGMAKTEDERRKIAAEISNIKQQTSESIARELVDHANAKLLDQETINAAAELGLIQLDQETKEYKVQHLDGDRIWNRIGTATGAVRDVAVTAGGAAAGFASGLFRHRPRRIGFYD